MGVQQTGNRERIVAHKLGVQSVPRAVCEQAVLTVFFQMLRRDARRLPICSRHQHLLDDTLQIPVALKIRSEPVEQFRVARPFALVAEIVHRLYQSRAENDRPPAIHGDACGERVLRRHQPIREIEARVAFAVRRRGIECGKKSGRHRGDLFAVLIVGTAHLDERVARLVHLDHHHRIRELLFDVRLRLFCVVNFLLRTGKGGGLCFAENFLQLFQLLRRAFVLRHRGDLSGDVAAELGDFVCGERASVDAQVVHTSEECSPRRAASADAKWLRRFDRVSELINDDLHFLRLAVDEHLHARALTGAIIGDGEVQERLRRQITLTLHVDRIPRPFVDEVKTRLRAVKLDIPSANVALFLHLAEWRAALGFYLQPRRNAEWLVFFKTKLVAVFNPARSIHAIAFVLRAVGEISGALFRSGNLLAVVAGTVSIRIERKFHDRALRLSCFQSGGESLFPLGLRSIELGFQFIDLLSRFGDFAVQSCNLLRLIRRRHRDDGCGIFFAHAVFPLLGHVVEKRIHRVKIALRDGIVFVVVALRAADCEAEPRHARRGDAIHHVEVQVFRLDDSALVARHHVTMKARRDFLLDERIRNQIARELLGREITERLVVVESLHHPVAPHPHIAQRIVVIAARICVTREVEPRHRHAFAEMRRREQAIHRFFVGVGRIVREKGVHLRWCRRKAREIERHATEDACLFLRWGKCEPRALETLGEEGINRRRSSGDDWHRRLFHFLKRPVPRVIRTLCYPALEQFDLRRLYLFVLLLRRHDFLRIGAQHTLD